MLAKCDRFSSLRKLATNWRVISVTGLLPNLERHFPRFSWEKTGSVQVFEPAGGRCLTL